MFAKIEFRPIARPTLDLIYKTYEAEGDPIAVYSRLMSAAMVSAAIIGLTQKQIAQQVEAMAPVAAKAVANRPDIFASSNSTGTIPPTGLALDGERGE